MSITCPWADHHITVSSSGTISTCCMAVPVIDSRSGQPYNIKTHTISEAYNSQEFNSIRTNLQNGVKDKNCDHCWQQEDIGERSLRLDTIPYYQEVYNSGRTQGLLTTQLDLSNQCNLKCRTCGPSDSSMWVKEHFDIYQQSNGVNLLEFQKNYNSTLHRENDFLDDFKNNVVPNLVVIKFQGGEPFLMKKQWDMIDSIIESNNSKNVLVGYHTNATIWNKDIENKLSNFKEVNLCLSIDDIGNRFEYIRHPGKWSEVEYNLNCMMQWCSQNPDQREVMINCVVTPYNLYTIHELLDYFISRKIDVKLHPTTLPNHFSISNIPENIKHVFLERLNSKHLPTSYQEEMNNVISVLTGHGEVDIWKQFLRTTRIHDRYRKENFEKTFPEFFKVISVNGK